MHFWGKNDQNVLFVSQIHTEIGFKLYEINQRVKMNYFNQFF